MPVFELLSKFSKDMPRICFPCDDIFVQICQVRIFYNPPLRWNGKIGEKLPGEELVDRSISGSTKSLSESSLNKLMESISGPRTGSQSPTYVHKIYLLSVYGAWCIVYGAWCMLYGAWCMVKLDHYGEQLSWDNGIKEKQCKNFITFQLGTEERCREQL